MQFYFTPAPFMKEIDSFDISILSILQENNFVAQRDIGEKVGLSAPAVQRRIKRMTELGYIHSNVSVLSREKLGAPITLIVEVALESEKIEHYDEVRSVFRSCEEVQQCYYVTGETDFILIVVVPSMTDYEKLTRRIFFSNRNIKNFRTFVTMDIVKLGLAIPL